MNSLKCLTRTATGIRAKGMRVERPISSRWHSFHPYLFTLSFAFSVQRNLICGFSAVLVAYAKGIASLARSSRISAREKIRPA